MSRAADKPSPERAKVPNKTFGWRTHRHSTPQIFPHPSLTRCDSAATIRPKRIIRHPPAPSGAAPSAARLPASRPCRYPDHSASPARRQDRATATGPARRLTPPSLRASSRRSAAGRGDRGEVSIGCVTLGKLRCRTLPFVCGRGALRLNFLRWLNIKTA